MVRFLNRVNSLSRLVHGKGMLDDPVRKRSLLFLNGIGNKSFSDGKIIPWGQGSSSSVHPLSIPESISESPLANDAKEQPSEMQLMKERFAKLLLGEDMSGGGTGVSSALALSNAITNLAASVFGKRWRLEPISAERKARWRKEIDLLLSVTNYIVEFVPSQQVSKDGTNMEIMVTQQRRDLVMNIPALRKLDAKLIEYLDNFRDQTEFWYVPRDCSESEEGSKQMNDNKWSLLAVKVPADGLSEGTRKWLQNQKELVNQVLKAAMAINAIVLMEMEIPDDYIESLPKNGRSSLGEALYKSITDDFFDPEEFLSSVDLSSEHKILDLKNRIEASVIIWQRKMHNKDGKSPWGSAVSLEKREQFEERAQTILLILKQRFPGIPQSSLDICKIQYNKDVGYSILESYSRILENLAFNMISRIEDIMYADSLAPAGPALDSLKRRPSLSISHPVTTAAKTLDPREEEIEGLDKLEGGNFLTLVEFKVETPISNTGNAEKKLRSEDELMKNLSRVAIRRKPSYLEKLEKSGSLRSPRSRH